MAYEFTYPNGRPAKLYEECGALMVCTNCMAAAPAGADAAVDEAAEAEYRALLRDRVEGRCAKAMLAAALERQHDPCDHSGIGKPCCVVCDPRVRQNKT